MTKQMTQSSRDQIVQGCLLENYGLSGSLRRLPGENLNLLLTTPQGCRYVVKIVGDEMPAEVVEMEFQAIEWARSMNFPLILPQTLENIHKRIETRIKFHTNKLNRLRIIDFIDGELLEDRSDISDVLIKNVAQSLARFNVALKDFDHPVARRTHRWNLTGTAQHRVKAQLITSPEKKALVNWGFDSWQQSESRLSTLPHQFIHGDANRENILVRGDQVIALVDFGDSCHNPTICDLAIGATYLMLDQEDPVETAALVVAAYHQVRPLSRAELATMYSLVCGRLAVSISVATARQTIDPENTNWFGSLESCYVLLEQLKSISSERFFSTLCSAVQM